MRQRASTLEVRTLYRTVVALIAMAGVVSAQPMRAPEAEPSSGGKAEGGGTKIPISVPETGELLGGAPIVPPVPTVSLEQPIDPASYICGPGDVFELDFWGAQNFKLALSADLEGRAFISKLGFVAVAGKSLAAVRTAVKAKARAIYPGLSFDLTLTTPRSFIVHVVDFVKQPGNYTSRALDRVSSVISRAGGSTGSRRRIQIKHRDGTTGIADLVRYELTGDVSYNPFLLDGDVVSVPFATPVVSISGAVRRAGHYELIGSKDLAELLELAGGFTSERNKSQPLRLLHRNAKQQMSNTELPFSGDTPPNVALEDGDQIAVRNVEELQRTVMIIGAVVGSDPLDPATPTRRVPYFEGDTVMSLIDRVGGLKALGDMHRSYISRSRPNQPPELIPIDLEALVVRRDFAADRPVQMNDMIVVPPAQYGVLVEGAVARSGIYTYNPMFGVPEYLAHAGGPTRTARELDEIVLIDSDGHSHPYRSGMKPSPGDAILLPERNFSRSEIAQLVLAGAGIVLSGIAVGIAATR